MKNDQVATHTQQAHPKTLQGLRLMLVEDHPINAKINARLLETSGAEVVCMRSGEEVLHALQSDARFDLILMDLNLGSGLSGLETTVVIRNKLHAAMHIPIIALTAGVVRQMHEEIYASGILAIIEKPFKLEEATRLIKQHIQPTRADETVDYGV